jgi:STE24 endopeptidase
MSEITATRIRRGTVLAAGAALWVLAAWALWRTRVPGDLRLPRLDQHRVFGAREVARAARFQRFLDVAWLLGVVGQAAALAVVARRAVGLAPRLALGRVGAGIVLAALASTAAWAAALPFDLAAHWQSRRYGISLAGYWSWLAGELGSLLAQTLALVVAVTVVMGLAGALGRRWWPAGAAALAAIAVVVVFLQPYVTTFGDRRNGSIGGIPIYLATVHRDTRAANDESIGIGPSRRIVVWDTMQRPPFTAAELRFALHHELAHQQRHHIWKGLAWFALLALPVAGLLELATARRGGLTRPAAVPLALLVLFVVQAAALLPLENAISRRIETEADWTALEQTRDPAAAIGAFRGFAQTSLQQPDPPWWDYVWLENHPTLLQRAELASAFPRLRLK